jgi:hypothetical protein
MMTDLFEALGVEDREWPVVAEDAEPILHTALDAERPVDLGGDGYDWDEA